MKVLLLALLLMMLAACGNQQPILDPKQSKDEVPAMLDMTRSFNLDPTSPLTKPYSPFDPIQN